MNMLNGQKIKYIFMFFHVLMMIISFFLSAHAYANKKETSTSSNATKVTFKASSDDDFLLSADYYEGKNKSGGVIVLHDCKNDRGRYNSMADVFYQQGLHTLSVDLRGYGESVSSEYSRTIIKKNTSDIVDYQSEIALLTAFWADDLIAAYHFLRSKVNAKQGIGIVTSGCSSAYAVALAENILLNAIVMITPQMTYADKERYKNLIDIPNYLITSDHHSESYQTANELFSWNGSKNSKIQVFKGNRYNYYLIYREKGLMNDIAYWLDSNVSR
jgi:hypothetical protein